MKNRYVTLAYILRAKWFMDQSIAESHFPLVLQIMENVQSGSWNEDNKDDVFKVNSNTIYAISEFGEAAPPEAAPQDSIALINMVGAITKYDYCGSAGVNTKIDLFNRALKNPNVKGVILRVDSGGGDGDATEVFANAIANADKPVVAFVDGTAASAAYKIIAGAKHIVMAGKSTEVGSIGAYVPFADFSKYYESKGINIKRIYAPQSDEKNKPIEDLFKGSDEAMKKYLKEYVQFFIDDVKQMRGSKLSDNTSIFKGAMFFGEAAIQNGLADHIGDLDFAASLILNEAEKNDNNNSNLLNMKKLSIKAGLVALAAFFGLEKGKDHEVEVSEEQLTKLDSQLQEMDSLKTAKQNAEAELATTKQTVADLNAKLTTANNRITELEKLAPNAGTDPAAGAKGKEGATETTESKEVISETDNELAKLKAELGITKA